MGQRRGDYGCSLLGMGKNMSGKGPQRRLITADAVKNPFFSLLEDYHHLKEARRRGTLVRDFAQLLLRLTTFLWLLLHPFILK